MEYSLVGEAFKFMVLGMLIVFVFLIVLVQVMKLQAKIINKYFPEKAPEVPTTSPQPIQHRKRTMLLQSWLLSQNFVKINRKQGF
jgi:oxaloacetate decarboxylase gamma subunit